MTTPSSPLTIETAREALKNVSFPGFSRDIVSFGIVKDVHVEGSAVTVQMSLTTQNPDAAQKIKEDSERVLRQKGFATVTVQIQTQTPQTATPLNPSALPRIAGVKKVVAVMSAKGGVGKSTVTVNLSCALQQLGCQVGLMDVDIHGPSIPYMIRFDEEPTVEPDERINPALAAGLKVMSMGYLMDPNKASVLRGPMISRYVNLFTLKVNWAPLDILLVDMPPGTGDAHLSLAQSIALDGGIVVTTPQEVAVGVTTRGIAMMKTIQIPILGLIENMSYYECEKCGHHADLFGRGGGRAQAERLGIPILGEIPIYPELRESGDAGLPIVLAAPSSSPAQAFVKVAQAIRAKLGLN